MIKAIILDDEVDCSTTLEKLLRGCCPEVVVQAICNTVIDTLTAIQEHQPELFFLDIEMPEINAFEFLDKVKPYHFELVLMSEGNEYAIDAIHYDAIDYLLKPVQQNDLEKAVEKARQRIGTRLSHKLETVLEQMHNINSIHNIALPTIEGLQMVAIDSIVYCTSNSNYTNFTLKDGSRINVCRTLKQVEVLLAGYAFIRVHQSFIVNLNEVKKYIKGEGGTVVMSDNSNISVSRSHKDLLLRKFQNGK